MKIGYDISQTGSGKAGCGFVAQSVIQELSRIDHDNEYILYPTFGGHFWEDNWAKHIWKPQRRTFRLWHGYTTHEASQRFWDHCGDYLEEHLGSPEIIHSNNFFCPIGLKKARLVYTLYDMTFVDCPDWSPEENRGHCFAGVFNASLYADMIVSISDYSRQRFLGTFPHFPEDRIVVAHLASRFNLNRGGSNAKPIGHLRPGRFWLNVGTLEPRKNQQRLVEAYANLPRDGATSLPLVLAGGRGWSVENLGETIDVLGLGQKVVMLGYVDDDSLRWLYQNCFALVYPSLSEGFGLPVLEAMTLGTAVIASNTTSIPEIVSEGAGILIDPYNTDAITEAMLDVLENDKLRAALRNQGQLRAKDFSWEITARIVLDCYKHAYENPR